MFSDELYELTGAVILDNGSRFSSSHTRQVLLLFTADGNYEVPVNMQLIDERLRNFGRARSDEDAAVRSKLAPASGTIEAFDDRIPDAQRAE